MSDVLLNVANDPSIVGFGSHSAKEVEEIQKALSISQNYGTTAPNALVQGSALSVEDLDRTLKLVTHGIEHLKLWKDIQKERASQTVSQYNVQNSYGQEVNPFFQMGQVPTQTDSNRARDFIQVKYLGTQGHVLHDLTLIQAAHGPVIANEVKNKTIELLARNERFMFEADSSINALEYDGIYTQVKNKELDAKYKATAFNGYSSVGQESAILDIRGAFDDEVAEDMALRNVNNFGYAMDCYLGTDIHSSFSKAFYAKQRTLPGEALTSGQRIKEHTGTLDFRFKPSLFNRPRKIPLPIAISASAAPTLANLASPVDAASEFLAADAGTYSYVISAVYADGETVASSQISGAVAAGDKVTIEITYTGTPLYFNIFRAPVGTTTGHEFIQRIAPIASGAAHDVDFNSYLPGAAKAFLLMHDGDVLCWKQLGSMIKYDLAVTDTSYRWLQLLYGTPLVAAPKKLTIAKNLF
ncbi:MAG: hypothetical protein MOGMAGMI_00341 [Candidatus Omnitrophica bacterium]|nr:hypothetical protein [Candidatus Omnitrophota bacterium]